MLVVLLAIAQLSVALHAAEYGSGDHSHNGIACLCAAIDDDNDGAPLPRFVQIVISKALGEKSAAIGMGRLPSDWQPPRATGPPKSV